MTNKVLNKVENNPINEITSNLKGYIGKGQSKPGTISLRNNVKSETIYISLDQFLEPELQEYVEKRDAKDIVRDFQDNHAINIEKDAGIEIINPEETKDNHIFDNNY